MDASLIQDLIDSNAPFQIETASGQIWEVPHRDYVSWSRRRTALHVSYEESGEQHLATVPLLTITAAMAKERV